MLGEMSIAKPLARTLAEAGAKPLIAGFDESNHSWDFEHCVISPIPRSQNPVPQNLVRNHAELLFHRGGFFDTASLLALIRNWISVLEHHAIDKVVGVAAPAAMLAAYVLRLPRVAMDAGYYTVDPLDASQESDCGGLVQDEVTLRHGIWTRLILC